MKKQFMVVGRRFYGPNFEYTEYTSDYLVYETKAEAIEVANRLRNEGYTNAHVLTKLKGEQTWLSDPHRAEMGLEVVKA